MGRYATREVELDALLRGRAFVDLHAVVKRALIASVERYSIKDLEPFFGYARAQDLREASMSRRIVENAIAAGDFGERAPQPPPHRRELQPRGLRIRAQAARLARTASQQMRSSSGTACRGRRSKAARRTEEIGDLDKELHRLRDGLLEGVPIEPAERTPEQQARFVLAHMMEFHRREDKASLVGILPIARPRRA